MGDIFGPKYDGDAEGRRCARCSDYLPLFVDKPLEFEPGSGHRYSNAGYIVLGLVIEKLSGLSYYDYVRTEHLRARRHERHRRVRIRRRSCRSVPSATRARRRTACGAPNHFLHGARGSSAGGGYSTAPDLLRFVNAFLAGKIIERASLLRMAGMPADTPADQPILMGNGWGGGAPGVNASVGIEGEWAVIVLSNYDPPAAE